MEISRTTAMSGDAGASLDVDAATDADALLLAQTPYPDACPDAAQTFAQTFAQTLAHEEFSAGVEEFSLLAGIWFPLERKSFLCAAAPFWSTAGSGSTSATLVSRRSIKAGHSSARMDRCGSATSGSETCGM